MKLKEDNAEHDDVNSETSPIKVYIKELSNSQTRVREAPNSSSPRPKEVVSDYDNYLLHVSQTPQIDYSPNI